MRAACAAAAVIVVASVAATASAAQEEEAGAPAVPTQDVLPTSSPLAATATLPLSSVLDFPVSHDMPEGRWASACSLACIIPGRNVTRTVLDESFAFGADVCIAHIDNEAASVGPGNATVRAREALSVTLATLNVKRRRIASPWPDPVVKYEPHAAQETTAPHCATGSRLVNGRPWWPAHPELLPVAKDDVSDEHRQLVADEAMVFGALAMGRNVLGGSVHRQVGVYDLVAVSVQRLGVCADQSCKSVVAVDTTRPSVPTTCCKSDPAADVEGGSDKPSAKCSRTNVPIITHVGPDGVERPVHMASSELLSLGKGMLGSPRWFQRAATPFYLGGQLSLSGPTLLVPMGSHAGLRSIQDGEETTQWDLNGTVTGKLSKHKSGSLPASSTSTPFLAHLATLVCAGSLRSFLASSSAWEGIRPWGRVRRASRPAEVQGNIMDAGVWAAAGKVEWTVTPSILLSAAAGDNPAPRPSLPYLRPAWTLADVAEDTASARSGFESPRIEVTPLEVIGRSSREVNPLSATEAKLADSLFQRQLLLPAAVVSGHFSPPGSELDMDVTEALSHLADRSGASNELVHELDRIAHAYDRRVFLEEHPAPPVSLADLVLAIIVVVPELGALLVLLLTTERWGRAALLGFSTIVVLGAVSISGVIALASQEAAGAAWRARSTRTSTNAVFSAGSPVNEYGMPTLAGTLVVVDTSLLLLAPTNYHPARVGRVAAVACGAYIIAAAAMAVRVLFIARQQRCARQVNVEVPPPTATNQAPHGVRWWWGPRPHDSTKAVHDSVDSEGNSGGDGGTAAAGMWQSFESGAVCRAAVSPLPASAGRSYEPSRTGGDRGGWLDVTGSGSVAPT